MCDLEEFLKITERFIPENYEEECKPKGGEHSKTNVNIGSSVVA
jgi:hypothetical protein